MTRYEDICCLSFFVFTCRPTSIIVQQFTAIPQVAWMEHTDSQNFQTFIVLLPALAERMLEIYVPMYPTLAELYVYWYTVYS